VSHEGNCGGDLRYTDGRTVLPKLLVLNAILCRQPGTVESVSKQRVIFFVRRVRPWLQDATAAPLPVRSEVCQSLTVLLPLMSDIYGEHWGDILSALTSSWQKTSELTDRDKYGLAPGFASHRIFANSNPVQSLT
jgi:hypothetical protein